MYDPKAATVVKRRVLVEAGVDLTHIELYSTTLSANSEYLEQLGADQVLDYARTPFEQVVGKTDVVIDLVGGETLARSYGVVRRGGMIVSTVQPHDAKRLQLLGEGPVRLCSPQRRKPRPDCRAR